MKEMVGGGCCVCSDERGWPENPLVYCDGASCNVAVHQACYGIVTVPTGPWFCRKCESQERSARVRCELCPSRTGALKKTNTSGWAHVVCALYIPEVRFGNVTTMEPINLDSIPEERYGKTCYICQEMNKGAKAQNGACMQCNKTGCRQQFHVTCAQQLGLLCEEAGNYLDNVKYCGYCQHHYSKLKKGGNVKLIPPYKPITYETGSSDGPSSPEKESEATGTGSGAAVGGTGAVGGGLSSATATLIDGPSSSGGGGPAAGPSSSSTISNNIANTVAAVAKGMGGSTSSSGGATGGSLAMGNSSANTTLSMQSGGVPASSSSTLSTSTTAAAATSSSSSSSSSNSKNRKSSSNSKGSGSNSSSSNSGLGSGASNNQPGSGSTGQSTGATSSGVGTGSVGSSSNTSGKSTSGSGSTSGSSKDYKDKHSKGGGKTPNSKDRDTYKDKSTKSASSSANSSSSAAASSSSKNKDGSSGHHHQTHGDSQLKIDHGRSEKSSAGGSGGGGGGSNKLVPNSSILAPSVLQQATAKEAVNKFPYTETTGNNSSSGNSAADLSGSGVPDGAGGAFVNEGKSSSTTSSSSATSAAPVATKKRKASDASKLHSVGDEKIPMKDVSVTLVPLQRQPHHDKNDGGDSKKVKSERGSPSTAAAQLSDPAHHHQHPSVAAAASVTSTNPSSTSSSTSAGVNLLATQTGATSISITKQPPSQSTTTNVIIKPPIIKDISSHLSAAAASTTTAAMSAGAAGAAAGGAGVGGSSVVTGGNGTTSLVVSVPLSQSPSGATLHLAAGANSSSASQNLFQQAIQNRSEHLNFPNASRTSSQQAQSRSSPIIATGGHHLGGGDGHVGMLHRQSPLIQASNLSIDNGGRSSLSPSMPGSVVHQSDSGMLKVTYEKQSAHGGNIVNPGNTNRLAALQDDAMSSSRRSSADCGIFQSAVVGGPSKGGLFSSTIGSSSSSVSSSSSKRGSNRDYGLVTSSSNLNKLGGTGAGGEKDLSNNPSHSNLFAHSSVPTGPSIAGGGGTFKSSSASASSTTTANSMSGMPFSSFVTSSRTPDFNAFSGSGGRDSSGGGGGLKISYEPQAALSVATASNTTLLTPLPSPSMSQMSGGGGGGGLPSIASNMIGAQPLVKDSPPSSPSSEAGSSARKRTRKQAQQESSAGTAMSGGDRPHGKVFQNGIHASHMLGNQLNPNSSVAQKMSDQLHMELEAHSVYTASEAASNLMGPMFPGKQTSASSSTSSSSSSGTGNKVQGPPSLSSMLSGGNTASGGAPQSLEQLLERQWEQGSQFLMEQAQHFDIASLLSCLHQLRAENVRLEDHVNNLVARRDHLLAVNARLAIPLNQSIGGSGSFNATTNGPSEPPPSNVIQRGGGGGGESTNSGGSSSRSGSRNVSHAGYGMENGIDFRSAAQQQQQHAMLMGGAGHQGGPGSGNSGAGGNPAGVVRTTTGPVAGGSNNSIINSGSGVVVVTSAGPSSVANSSGVHMPGSMNIVSVAGMGGNGVRLMGNSSNTNNTGHHQLNSSSCSSSSVGGPAVGGHNGLLGSGGAVGPMPSVSSSSLMGGVVGGSAVVGGTNSGVVTALGMISGGASRPLPNAPVGITYPTTFQHFRRDDAQMKPS